jgi:CO/xanthine dehydrogenase Mo-binding subunit
MRTSLRRPARSTSARAREPALDVDNVLAGEKVLYHGHPIAAVAATDLHTAEDASR